MTPTGYENRLGRLASEDPRDKAFRMGAVLAPIPVPSSRYWNLGPQLDQGNTPECVGYSTRQLLQSSPHRYKKASPTADEIYHGAQVNDEWPGEDYDGTSARGAMKFLQAMGIIAAYHWAQSVEEACEFVLTTGPVLVGANWHQDMFTVDPQGFIHPTGPVVGGHEFLWYGYNHKTGILTFDNSWGHGWGTMGHFRMRRAEFEQLMADQGDMVAPIEA